MVQKRILALLFFLMVIGCNPLEDRPITPLFWGLAIEGFPISKNLVLEKQEEVKFHPQIILFYLQWPKSDDFKQIADLIPSLDAISEMGAVPCVTWEPMIIEDQQEKTIPFEEILKGKYDAYLKDFAKAIAAWKKPLLIRFAHEMNLDRYHWGTDARNFGETSPPVYVKMFRYVVDSFKNENVSNAAWVFCPNADSVPNAPWNVIANYYPGDAYVDILGMDGYDWNRSPEMAKERNLPTPIPKRSFEEIFKPLFEELRRIAPHKPVFVFETATVSRKANEIKAEWIENALRTANKWDLKGIIWFQAHKEEDWRLNQNSDYTYVPLMQRPEISFQQWLRDFMTSNSNK